MKQVRMPLLICTLCFSALFAQSDNEHVGQIEMRLEGSYTFQASVNGETIPSSMDNPVVYRYVNGDEVKVAVEQVLQAYEFSVIPYGERAIVPECQQLQTEEVGNVDLLWTDRVELNESYINRQKIDLIGFGYDFNPELYYAIQISGCMIIDSFERRRAMASTNSSQLLSPEVPVKLYLTLLLYKRARKSIFVKVSNSYNPFRILNEMDLNIRAALSSLEPTEKYTDMVNVEKR